MRNVKDVCVRIKGLLSMLSREHGTVTQKKFYQGDTTEKATSSV